ncbi:MAG: hypothetical protein HXS41_15000 [Theionarchaea archaeon]|nr:hypothetical protein [Theionarchaea archaeon]MBU6999470.1 hypothetical protein [Theionarchaea archaeon]MBU7022359.1 hypothetical protein [Theionarchaea archaeon]MBU7036098.1 hypothetical protein [Theionarchaea archaeon]MBU7041792.1 hypothetical protein [Theionarchaea archaeon]
MNKTIVLLSIVALTLFAGAAYAYPGRGGGQSNGQELSFVDEDNDGVCDYAQNGQCNGSGNGGFVDNDNDGVCDNYQYGHRYGYQNRQFVDEDNDGVCDYAQNGQCNGNGTGDFVDEDNDGICDHAETGNGNRRGSDR